MDLPDPIFEGGVTASERYLGKLCRATFLSVWSYQNLFRDQGGNDLGGKGKELSDAMVVFGDEVILFSDKRCMFAESAPLRLAWARWHKAAILDSAKQLHGAERWLKQHPQRVFTDQACTQRLQVPFPNPNAARFHRIAVASGATKACAAHLGSARGTLMIAPDEPPPLFRRDGEPETSPFVVGDVDPLKGFVHVMDELALDLVLQELDTVRDFVDYLTAKESLIRAGKLTMAAGEEEILAFYIKHRYLGPANAFKKVEHFTGISLDEGLWDELSQSEPFLSKKRLDQVSYLWDSIIEECAAARRAGKLVPGSAASFEDHESILRAMASCNRFERRNLSAALQGVVEKAGETGQRIARMDLPQDGRKTAHVFLALPEKDWMKSQEEYRQVRRFLLISYCRAVGLDHRQYSEIIGIATEAGFEGGHSHDFVKFVNAGWTLEREAEVRQLKVDLKILRPSTMIYRRSRPLEFPHPAALQGGRKRPSRNETCPCGSGAKYKRCCGR